MKLMVKFASAGVDLIVVDSVGAGVPEKFFADHGNGQQQVGLLAQKWSQFLPIFKKKISDSKTAVIGISQLREKMGGMGGFGQDILAMLKVETLGSITHVSTYDASGHRQGQG